MHECCQQSCRGWKAADDQAVRAQIIPFCEMLYTSQMCINNNNSCSLITAKWMLSLFLTPLRIFSPAHMQKYGLINIFLTASQQHTYVHGLCTSSSSFFIFLFCHNKKAQFEYRLCTHIVTLIAFYICCSACFSGRWIVKPLLSIFWLICK